MQTDTYLNLLMSVLAILISGCALGWTMYRDLIRKGRLLVNSYIADLYEDGQRNEKPWLFTSITNLGERPVKVINLGGRSKSDKKGFVIVTNSLPTLIQPGDCLEITVPVEKNLHDMLTEYSEFGVYDSANYFYSISKKSLKRLDEQARSINLS